MEVGGLIWGGTPGGTTAVGIRGPGPDCDKGAGGIACQPPREFSLTLVLGVGDTWGGSPMLIMSTARRSTPFKSTFG